VIACICAWLGVVLIVVALASSYWLEADGFHQGLWKCCKADEGNDVCFSTDRGLLLYLLIVTNSDE